MPANARAVRFMTENHCCNSCNCNVCIHAAPGRRGCPRFAAHKDIVARCLHAVGPEVWVCHARRWRQ